ncbi:NAD(+) diphosphatase [Martiniozyma asiatica (nom. inval.)]|nr:NAD(+) diphosphatase [Martiniozyma asiatica]
MGSDIFFASSSHINRFGYLRRNAALINKIVSSGSAQLIVFRRNPTTNNHEILAKDGSIHRESNWGDLLNTWGQWNAMELKEWCDWSKKWGKIVWLGIDEQCNLLNYNEKKLFKDDEHSIEGIPIFAIDITQSLDLQNKIEKLISDKDSNAYWVAGVAGVLKLSNEQATLFSYARMMLDFVVKHEFCPGCGGHMTTRDAGSRLVCLKDNGDCNVGGSNNVLFPRTDPVVIIALRDENNILLGHNARRHKAQPTISKVTVDGVEIEETKYTKFYSCFSGFMEPGESFEQACVREVYEETGVKLLASDVRIVESQPWPFPSNLMVGCVGVVKGDQILNTELDGELEDVRWFDANSVLDKKGVLQVGPVVDGKRKVIEWITPQTESVAGRIINKIAEECSKSKF